MANISSSIIEYLTSIGALGDELLSVDEQEPNFYVTPWINYDFKSEESDQHNFLLRLRYKKEAELLQIQFWGRDFYEEWLETNKYAFVSILANRINNKLNIGSLWLDLDTGEVALVAAMILSKEGIDVAAIKSNIDRMILLLHKYYPILFRYIKSEGAEEDFNDAIEAIQILNNAEF